MTFNNTHKYLRFTLKKKTRLKMTMSVSQLIKAN